MENKTTERDDLFRWLLFGGAILFSVVILPITLFLIPNANGLTGGWVVIAFLVYALALLITYTILDFIDFNKNHSGSMADYLKDPTKYREN